MSLFSISHDNFFTLLATKPKHQHRGEVLQAIIRRSSITITMLAKRMGISRNTVYRNLEDPALPFETLERYGKILKYDFKSDFPQMHSYAFEEPIEQYGPAKTFEEALQQAEYYKHRYFLLLEKYTTLIEEKLAKK